MNRQSPGKMENVFQEREQQTHRLVTLVVSPEPIAGAFLCIPSSVNLFLLYLIAICYVPDTWGALEIPGKK